MNRDLDPHPYRSGESDWRDKGSKTGMVGGFVVGFVLTEFVGVVAGGGIVAIFGQRDHDRLGTWVVAILFIAASVFAGRLYVVRRKMPFYKWSSAGILLGMCVACLLSGLCFGGFAYNQ
jgi:hypothetical protein